MQQIISSTIFNNSESKELQEKFPKKELLYEDQLIDKSILNKFQKILLILKHKDLKRI